MAKRGLSDDDAQEGYWGFSSPMGKAPVPAAPVTPPAGVGPLPSVPHATHAQPLAPASTPHDVPTPAQPIMPPVPVAVPIAVPVAAPAFQAASRGTMPTPVEEEEALPEPTDDEPDDIFEDITDDDVKPPKKKRNRTADILLLVLAVLLMAGGATLGIVTWARTASEVTYPDMNGRQMRPDDPSEQDPTWVKEAHITFYDGLTFEIPSVGLNVPLGEVNQVRGVISPPDYTSAFRVRNLGVNLDAAGTGTVYIVTHSARLPGQAPGNLVQNIAARSVIVMPGAVIKVGNLTYTATSSMIFPKTELGSHAELWANTPGMLVFITCLQYTNKAEYAGGSSHDNIVIIGQLVK